MKKEEIKSDLKLFQQCDSKMIRLSDDSLIRALVNFPNQSEDNFTFLLVSGWGSAEETWDEIAEVIVKSFNLIYVETREKETSILNEKSKHDLDRISKDIEEVIKFLNVDEKKLVIFGSSWGAIVVADGLTKKRFSSFLTVFSGPLETLPLPFPTKYIVDYIPSFLLGLVPPISVFWAKKFKSGSKKESDIYITNIGKCDAKKWKLIGKNIARLNFLESYKHISCPCLIITASEDKMHDVEESMKIASLIPECKFIDMKHFDDFHSPLVIHLIIENMSNIKVNCIN